MILSQRIEAFIKVGNFLKRHFNNSIVSSEQFLHEGLNKVIEIAYQQNNWFIPDFINFTLQQWANNLNEKELNYFCKSITNNSPQNVAIICAGNIPMVGFHDILCVLLTSHNAVIKLSSDDNVIIPFLLKLLCHYDANFEKKIFFADGKLSNFNAVIATGSNNTASHFEFYFSKYKHIIRKNRTSLAVITGKEDETTLKLLGSDIFTYFGLGCRNVSKLLVPKNYNFKLFFEAIVDFGFVINNKKYGNNYDYNRAIFLLEKIAFLDNNFVMLSQSTKLHSPLSVIYYDEYESVNDIANYINENKSYLQCAVGKGLEVPFGQTQHPKLNDFADNVDTIKFLLSL
ncbi:MAG: acyl-CoA reductase [Bacteroidetes bacterium]|nr:acyl-CoA reductase [Bacteroidota bacterium]